MNNTKCLHEDSNKQIHDTSQSNSDQLGDAINFYCCSKLFLGNAIDAPGGASAPPLVPC
jgi:hypothetical protein